MQNKVRNSTTRFRKKLRFHNCLVAFLGGRRETAEYRSEMPHIAKQLTACDNEKRVYAQMRAKNVVAKVRQKCKFERENNAKRGRFRAATKV